ncbi:MAG: transcription-repair coupling factor [Bacillota bacterium]
MLKKIISNEYLGGNYYRLQKDVDANIACNAFGVPVCAKPILASNLSKKIFYVVKDSVEAREVEMQMSEIANVVMLCEKPELLLQMKTFSSESYNKRLTAIYQLSQLQEYFCVATVEAVCQIFPNADNFKNAIIKLNIGEDFFDIAKKLTIAGYKRVERVETAGEFSIRGDICDVVLPDGNAYRVDFFGDEVEKIRSLDLEEYRSKQSFETLDIYPATDIFFDGVSQKVMLENLRLSMPKPTTKEGENKAEELYERYEIAIENRDGVKENSQILPLTKTSSVFPYLSEETAIVFSDLHHLENFSEILQKQHQSRFSILKGECEILLSSISQLSDFTKFVQSLKNRKVANFASFATTTKNRIFEKIYNFKITPTPQYLFSEENLHTDIRNWRVGGYNIVICGKDKENAKFLQNRLNQNDIFASLEENTDVTIEGVTIVPINYPHGFCLHETKVVLIGTNDVIRKERTKTPITKKKNPFTSFDVGDYVVHENHGIGKLEKIDKVSSGGTQKDYAILSYKDGTVYLPVDQMDMLSRYSGTDKIPSLSKIGGREFEKVKEKVAKSLKEMAINLRKLYDKRERQNGFSFSQDSPLLAEFEESFPFEETRDQLSAIADVKNDMQSTKIMDRLICGDVGFGKTEVAFRSAFKAVENGKQVCFLAPTTILSEQHYISAMERFKGFGIRLGCINRFRTKQQQKLIIDELSRHKIDIIFGTHRLLSKDIIFQDLGLLILDEEQRFGVEHKEKIKVLKDDVDVLAMSATPIPRTLNMSLSGIRSISTIETPPKKRLPIQTVVAEETSGLIKDACTRELARGGQVFILYNRVESIDTFALKIQNLLPDAKVIVTHGQMKSSTLEKSIEAFASGDGDILVATTIIENGINIPRANTMVVIDADRLGLSQAYQLKGRVGRSDKLAYVYFTYKENKVLSENAYKRLNAITEFSEFGSGFKIAMRDLEIRGAGSLLGREQSGHMEKIGYETYTKLLKEAIGEIDGEKSEEKILVEVETDENCFIDANYIKSQQERMEIYYQLAIISSVEELNNILSQIEDAHGYVRKETVNLAKIGYIKNLAQKYAVKKVIGKGGVLQLVLSKTSMGKAEVASFLEKYKHISSLEIAGEIVVVFKKCKGDFFDDAIRILE